MSGTPSSGPASPGTAPGLADRFNAAIYEPFLAVGERRGMGARRSRLLERARGRVLEIGAGTGLNVERYPAGLESLVLAEPDPGMRARLARRVARAAVAAEVVDAPAEALPFADRSFDTVVSTMVLCTVADPATAVLEVRRVLRPDGRLLLIEHVRADTPLRARAQDALAAPWRAFAQGCRCNQPTLELLRGAFGRVETEPAEWRGMPGVVRPLVVGNATA